MTATCPACGHAVDPHELLVDLNNNTVTRFGLTVFITPTEAEILTCISEAYPTRLKTARLIERVYGAWERPEGGRRSLQVTICKMRRRLAPLGITIPPGW